MTLATAIALLSALASAGELINRIIEEHRAAGHPENAPLSPEHQSAIFNALKLAAESIPQEHQDALSAAAEVWDEDHAGEGG
jgi:hypothetical protein